MLSYSKTLHWNTAIGWENQGMTILFYLYIMNSNNKSLHLISHIGSLQ